MDLRAFYQKMRKVEQEIPSKHVVVVSHETADGGKAGRKTEVPREIAARIIVEDRARLATQEESDAYHAAQDEARKAAEQEAAANRMQVNLISDAALIALKNPPKIGKN